MPLTLWIPLVEIDGPLLKLWRELGSKWEARDYLTTQSLADETKSELLTAHGLHELHVWAVWALDSQGGTGPEIPYRYPVS